jgi:MCM OB domain
VDQQTIKLQEAPDAVPVGELPRHIILSADRFVLFMITGGQKPWVPDGSNVGCDDALQLFDGQSRPWISGRRHRHLFHIRLSQIRGERPTGYFSTAR